MNGPGRAGCNLVIPDQVTLDEDHCHNDQLWERRVAQTVQCADHVLEFAQSSFAEQSRLAYMSDDDAESTLHKKLSEQQHWDADHYSGVHLVVREKPAKFISIEQ